MNRLAAPSVSTRRALIISCLGAVASIGFARKGVADDPWSVATPLPFPVQEIYPVALGDRIVLAGGIIDDPQYGIGASARTVIYQESERVWADGPDLPIALHHPGLVARPDQVLAIGGFAANSDGFWQMQKTVFLLDRASKAWMPGPGLPMPRAEFVGAYLDEHVVIVGGRTPRSQRNRAYSDHADVDDTLLFDPTNHQWRSGRPAPTARNSAAGAILDDKLHIVGGRQSVVGGIRNVDVHEVYDPRADIWSTRAPMPQAQGGLAAAAFNNKLYAFGGEFFDKGSGVYKEAWAYDPLTDNWKPVAPMPIPRHGLGAAALAGGIHLIGGAIAAGAKGRSRRHDVFRPT
ncbi:MAG: kelch repeat-containing protein [Pseudomonadota bacterium]